MGLNKKAQDYLDKCRVIGPTEVKEGIVISSNPCVGFKVSKIIVKGNDVDEEYIEEFSLADFCDEDDSKMILNFKKTVSDIIGRKRYYIETGVYKLLANEDIDPDEFDDEEDLDYDDAEERAMREAEEEEEAEHAFERFLKAQEEL